MHKILLYTERLSSVSGFSANKKIVCAFPWIIRIRTGNYILDLGERDAACAQHKEGLTLNKCGRVFHLLFTCFSNENRASGMSQKSS
jgi:hypothetical protein